MSQRKSTPSQRIPSSQRTPSSQRIPISQRIPSSQRNPSSQRSQSQRANTSQAIEEPVDVDRLVAEVIQYFLVMEQKKFPIKRADIIKLLNGITSKNFKTVISHAKKYLLDVFGFSLHEFDEKSGHYILLNKVTMPKNLSHQDLSESNTVLFLTLAAIFLSEGQIMEDEIWNMLSILGYKTEEYKKLVTNDFVRQLYINIEAVPQSDPPKLTLKWGERAGIEFSKKKVLEFAALIYGQSPEEFGNLWNVAESEEKERREVD